MIVFEFDDQEYDELEYMLEDLYGDVEKVAKCLKKKKAMARHLANGAGEHGRLGERNETASGTGGNGGYVGERNEPMNHLGTGNMGERYEPHSGLGHGKAEHGMPGMPGGYPGMPMMMPVPVQYFDPYMMDRRYKN